jgi:hypothetical protein
MTMMQLLLELMRLIVVVLHRYLSSLHRVRCGSYGGLPFELRRHVQVQRGTG